MELSPGFRLLVDFTQFEAMDPDCLPEVGKMMELVAGGGVSTVVRVIPDPSKDVGMNILALFHYPRSIQFFNCESMTEAAKYLSP
jgi:hypothetical protein